VKGIAGKSAIVTGGARGLGRAIVERLAAEGAKVVIADVLEEEAQATRVELTERGLETSVYKVDLRNISEIEKLMAFTEERYGSVDVLVNCAAIQIRGEAVSFTEESWDKICDINLKAVFFASQAAAKRMIPKGTGSIVCISSGTSIRYTSVRSPYNITKAAVNALTGALANEWARYGVRVNAVAPGWSATQMVMDGVKMGYVAEAEIMSMVPLNRFMEPREIADAVCFLASEEASGVVGQTLFVDGGGSLRLAPEDPDLAEDLPDDL
jgi:NAD(P)-dependent dehydrogenase (short-subunit alcohol dehydrogenase family)